MMASRVTQSPSRIPVPVKSSPSPNQAVTLFGDNLEGEKVSQLHQSSVAYGSENGSVKGESKGKISSLPTKKGKGFETYLMTGEMIIRTNLPANQKDSEQKGAPVSKTVKESHIPKFDHYEPKQQGKATKVHQVSSTQQAVVSSPKVPSKIPGLIKSSPQQAQQNNCLAVQNNSSTENTAATADCFSDFPLIQAPVAEEELSDLSQSSCSESELTLENDVTPPSASFSLPTDLQTVTPTGQESSRLEEAMETLGQLQSTLPDGSTVGFSDTSFSEPPSSGDSGFVHDGHHSDWELVDRGIANTLGKCQDKQEEGFVSDETLTEKQVVSEGNLNNLHSAVADQVHSSGPSMIASSSGEKFLVHGNSGERPLVRTSKSHENYLQAGTGIALVNINIDDNLAYSLDTLAYHDSSNSSLDNVTLETAPLSRSLQNSPEKKSDKSGVSVEREFIPGFINLEDSKPINLKLNRQQDESDESMDFSGVNGRQEKEMNNSGNVCTKVTPGSPSSQRLQAVQLDDVAVRLDENDSIGSLDDSDRDTFQHSLISDDSDADSIYHQPSKAVDRPSAERLAKRLFNLEGFRKSDVSRHLCKKNDFSTLVAEEYLKFFDFQEDTLDSALRKFLQQFSLYGETQERERVLAHFSHRFMECNPGSFNSEDACHTLTCAIMLLNSDLHAPNVSRRMTCQEFIENLAELNDGEHFSKEVLKAIYQAIKNEPIEWAMDTTLPPVEDSLQETAQPTPMPVPQVLGSNPFLEVPDPSKTVEYKKGYVMRKCCMEPDRRKTPFGKRGWKMMYAVLRDLILYQYKDEHQLKKGQFVENTHNAIRIHHALATKATDYTKKQHVLRLQTADGAEFLLQTGDSKELLDWMDTLNLVAASLSAPVLPGAVGSKAKFQRPLMPSSYTTRNLREQLHSHESRVQELEQELLCHRGAAPEKGAKSSVIQEFMEKETYLEYEIKRFKTYAYLLQGKLSAYPELEPSLVETTIGEYEEMAAGHAGASPVQTGMVKAPTAAASGAKPVQRSLSDRYSYRAAIYQTDGVEYDMV